MPRGSVTDGGAAQGSLRAARDPRGGRRGARRQGARPPARPPRRAEDPRRSATPRTREELLGEARVLLARRPRTRRCRSCARTSSTATATSSRWTGSTAPTWPRCCASAAGPGSRRRACSPTSPQAAEALTHLHAQDPPVIHGDVKPGEPDPHQGRRASSSSTSGCRRRRARRPPRRARRASARRSSPPTAHPRARATSTRWPRPRSRCSPASAPAGVLPSWDGIDPAQAEQLEAAIRARPGDRPGAPARRRPGELVERLRGGWAAALPTGVMTLLPLRHRGLDGAVGRRPGRRWPRRSSATTS